MELTTKDLKTIARFDIRLRDLAKRLANVHPEHDEDRLSIQWQFDDDDNPTKIRLDLESYDHRNTSCSCHPEYELHVVYSQHVISLEDILNDDFYFANGDDSIYDTCRPDHPLVLKYISELNEKQEREKNERLRKQKEEEARRAAQVEQQERATLARLQSKYNQ